jgi:hypothetical protein
MRENVFLPAHLSKPQRKLVFNERSRKILEEEPVKLEVAGEEFTLKYIDKLRDQPNTIKGLFAIIDLMKKKSDWSILPMLLEGLKTSGRKLEPRYFEKLVRKAAQASRQDITVESARMVARTGFELKDLNLVREVFFWIQYRPISLEGEPKNIKRVTKALLKAEHVAILLEDEKHSGGMLHGDTDPRIRPEVIGVLLELAAMRASLRGAKDEDGKVEMYAQRLLSTLGRGVDLRQELQGAREWDKRSALLCYLTPIIYGMREAVKILEPGSETVQHLKERLPALSKMADVERELLMQEIPEGSSPLGAWCYDKLIIEDR